MFSSILRSCSIISLQHLYCWKTDSTWNQINFHLVAKNSRALKQMLCNGKKLHRKIVYNFSVGTQLRFVLPKKSLNCRYLFINAIYRAGSTSFFADVTSYWWIFCCSKLSTWETPIMPKKPFFDIFDQCDVLCLFFRRITEHRKHILLPMGEKNPRVTKVILGGW